jgi:hypothetical protein
MLKFFDRLFRSASEVAVNLDLKFHLQGSNVGAFVAEF